MPRGGSKKGEHRGNAKARDDGTPSTVMRAAVARKKPAGARKATHLVTVEKDIMIAQAIHGVQDAGDMMPKQLMLDNMRHFQNAAYQYKAMAKFMAETMPDTPETRRAISQMEALEDTNRRVASDEAYKVAPFVHPRKAAIAMLDDDNVGEDIVQMMFDEIDRRNRENPLVIEHIPQKRTA